MNDIQFDCHFQDSYRAWRDPEGFYGHGATKRDAVEDLIRQEQDWEDALRERIKYNATQSN